MKVVDLADKFGLTSSEAIDACLWAGVPADSSATELSTEDARRVRDLISGWIDEGFAPWRSQEEGHATKKGSARTKAVTSVPPGSAGKQAASVDSSTAILEPSNGKGAPGAQGRGMAEGADGDRTAAAATEPGPAEDRGPVLPPVRGGPTGWLPGGPEAQSRQAPLAIVALALAIVSIVIPFVTAVLAIVLAAVAKDRIERSRGWKKGERLATAAQVVAGVGIGLWLVLLVGELVILQRNSNREAPVDIQVDTESVPYDQISIGDCVRLPRLGALTQWTKVRCDDAHQAEVFARLDAGNALGSRYPGDGPIGDTAKADCRRKLTNYVQDPSQEAGIEIGYAYPSASTWTNEADRTIWCVAFERNGTLVSASYEKPGSQVTTTAAS